MIDRAVLLERALVEASLQSVPISAVREEMEELERNGTLLRLPGTETVPRWTTPALVAVEAALLRAADRPEVPSRINAEILTAAFAAAPELSAEQWAAVEYVVAPGGVTVIEAGAGTGKTTIARVLVYAAARSGLKVQGLAPSWQPRTISHLRPVSRHRPSRGGARTSPEGAASRSAPTPWSFLMKQVWSARATWKRC